MRGRIFLRFIRFEGVGQPRQRGPRRRKFRIFFCAQKDGRLGRAASDTGLLSMPLCRL